MLCIGPYTLRNSLFLAPMVGVSDAPFREICSQQGAGLTVGEMLPANSELWKRERNRLKQIKPVLDSPHVVQIAGSEPQMMADAARMNIDMGADAIDINMGCPAKKVLKKAAGSALLKDEKLVSDILEAVVNSVSAPVTLKIRTGWSPETRNGVTIAKIAEQAGIQLLTVHGRTRACRFKGTAEYDTIADIKQAVSIPIIANGDIDSPDKAAEVLKQTDVDGLMIGRAAWGRPWIFSQIEYFLATGEEQSAPELSLQASVIRRHMEKLYAFYGDQRGVLYARKHVAEYVDQLPQSKPFRTAFNQLENPQHQLDSLQEYFAILEGTNGALAA
ncbi:MAG: tRNA dihydrouridine synthase DusB [Pseudohongiellaceae bacterium]